MKNIYLYNVINTLTNFKRSNFRIQYHFIISIFPLQATIVKGKNIEWKNTAFIKIITSLSRFIWFLCCFSNVRHCLSASDLFLFVISRFYILKRQIFSGYFIRQKQALIIGLLWEVQFLFVLIGMLRIYSVSDLVSNCTMNWVNEYTSWIRVPFFFLIEFLDKLYIYNIIDVRFFLIIP